MTSTQCNCVYNKSGKCKHVAAMTHYVKNSDSITKTAIEQQWGKPSVKKMAQEKYAKGKYMCEMFPPRERKKNLARPLPVDASELDDCPLKIVLSSESKGVCELAVQNLMFDVLNMVESNLLKEECASSVKILLEMVKNCPVYGVGCSEQQIGSGVANFYKTKILLSGEGINYKVML